jgi:hypothetical protein
VCVFDLEEQGATQSGLWPEGEEVRQLAYFLS